MKATTVVVADDHQLVRSGLCALLAAQPDFVVVAEAGDGLEAVQVVARTRPDVAVLDVLMPGLNGLAAARQMRRRCPDTRIVMLTMHTNVAYAVEALREGAMGYVFKDSTAADLVAAVRTVVAGRRFLSPPLSEAAVADYRRRSASRRKDPYDSLTPREHEVLQMVAEGRTSQEIALRLSISRRTVEVHRAHVVAKLGLPKTADLVRFAVNRGIVGASAGPRLDPEGPP